MIDRGLVVFDWYGTLVRSDDIGAPVHRLQRAIEDVMLVTSALAGRAAVVVSQVMIKEALDRNAPQSSSPRLLMRALGDEGVSVDLIQALEVLWRCFGARPVEVVDGAAELLSALTRDGHTIRVLSNGPLPSALLRRMANDAGLGRFIDKIISTGDGGPKKPQPEAFSAASTGTFAFTMMVGDNAAIDITPALALGWQAVEAGSADELAAVRKLVNNPARDEAPDSAFIDYLDPYPLDTAVKRELAEILRYGFTPYWGMLEEYVVNNWPVTTLRLRHGADELCHTIRWTRHRGGSFLGPYADPDAHLSLESSLDDYLAVHRGEIDFIDAMADGRLRITGDASVLTVLPFDASGGRSRPRDKGQRRPDTLYYDGVGEEEFCDAMRRTSYLLAEGIRVGAYSSVQLYVSAGGTTRADMAMGSYEAASDAGRTGVDTIYGLLCAGKPVTALAVARLWETGRIRLDAPVGDFVHGFTQAGKEAVTIRHLLTHTAGLTPAIKAAHEAVVLPMDVMVATICAQPLRPGWIPGRRCAYDMLGGWYMLGAVVEAVAGRPLSDFVREEVFGPLGLTDLRFVAGTGNGEKNANVRRRLGRLVHRTADHEYTVLSDPHAEARLTHCNPATGLLGPVGQLARLYEAVHERLTGDRTDTFGRDVLEAFTTPHCVGMIDEAVGSPAWKGLGFETKLTRYSPYCSHRTFGHTGDEGRVRAFCDPEAGLVVGALFNGVLVRRMNLWRPLVSAVYEDCGLT